ncbi:MAG TPA: carboxypeptidase regulatory-like domain-containing protein [Candidatus Dormibacteraeota bacterium]|nr:carboxypeptidase regulatory-like domain-containing protein [Candidatus Dormibacteraeota bacterium]
MPQAGYTVQNAPGGTIEGKLLWVGKPERPHRMAVTLDRGTCGAMKEMYDVQVEQGGVVGAVVWLDNITHGKAFAFPKAVLDQKKCMFVPDVLIMKPGQMEVLNSDNVTHNVHIIARNNRSSNEMMAPGAPAATVTLMHPENILVRCDIHPWMHGYIIVAKNPYYVTSGPGGSFTLTDVPAGTYTLDVWQDKIGTKEQQVTVQAGKTTTVTFKLGR